EFAVFVENQLTASDTAIRTNRARYLSIINARMHCARLLRHRLGTSAVFAFADLANNRPFREPGEHTEHLTTFWRGRQSWCHENGPVSSDALAQLACECATRQRIRLGTDIFRKRQHLESASEHFRMKERLQFALRFARIR